MTIASGRKLLNGFSLEMTGKDIEAILRSGSELPQGTNVNVTFLGNEDLTMRVEASRAILAAGLTPVPHLAARRLPSNAALEELLSELQAAGASESIFVVGGDPVIPDGPFPDSEAVIRSGLLPKFGVRRVGIAGYPDGHPSISDDALWSALDSKIAALTEQGLETGIITQFGFDEASVLRWIERSRERGVDVPIRVGVPGPAGVKRLIAYAGRFGVGANAMIVKKYGFSLANLVGRAGPDAFIDALAADLEPERHGTVHLHFYTFGGVQATVDWIDKYRAR